MSEKYYGSGWETLFAHFDSTTRNVDFAYSPNGGFGDLPQIGYDDGEFLRTPYISIPRLSELGSWLLQPSKNTNWFLFWNDPVVQGLNYLFSSLVIGDGVTAKILVSRGDKAVDDELSDICNEWLQYPCGKSPDQRGKSLNNFVLPLIMADNVTCGASAWYKFIGNPAYSPNSEIGEMMIRWLDPRSYVPLRHDYYGWFKLIQFPIIQPGLPVDRDRFDTEWRPAFRNRTGNYQVPGPSVDAREVHLTSDKFYWFDIFLRPLINSVLQHLVSKVVLTFYRDKFIEKATFPFFLIRVPRHAMRDANEEKFKEKLNYISKIISEYRTGDAVGIEGEEYDEEGNILSKGWEVVPVDISKSSIPFAEMFRQIDEQISYGMIMSMASISPSGVSGMNTTIATGGQIGANTQMSVKRVRRSLADTFKFILQDVILFKTGILKEIDLIDLNFSKIRVEDLASFLNVLSTFRANGALMTNEMREHGEDLGLPLEPMPDELTSEGQMLAQMGAEAEAAEDEQGLGIGEGPEPEIPDSFLRHEQGADGNSSGKNADGTHKHKDAEQGKRHDVKTKHRKVSPQRAKTDA